jgi:hypothetical protein
MTSYHSALTGANVVNSDDPSEIIAGIGFAVLPVTVRGLADGRLSGPSLQAKAAIDTGATTSALYPSLAANLDLQRVSRELGSGGGPVEEQQRFRDLYQVRISLNDGGDRWERPVMIRPYDYENLFQLLIGLDILTDCRFTYDGPSDSYTLDRLR